MDKGKSTNRTSVVIEKDSIFSKSFYFPQMGSREIERIAKAIETQSEIIQTEQTHLTKLQSIKAGLMADLMSGKKPVKVEEDVIYQMEN